MPKMKKAQKKSKEDIISFLEDSIKDDDDLQDHGNRETKAKREKATYNDSIQKKQKLDNYEAALEKAREKTKYSQSLDDEYDELEKAIESQRKKAQLKQQSNTKVEDVVKGLLAQGQALESSKKKDEETEIVQDEETKRRIEEGEGKKI